MGIAVVPQPVSVIERGGSSFAERRPEALEGALEASEHVMPPSSASGNEESYVLDISADGIRIEATDAAGAFYARQTLAQLTDAEGRVPFVRIVDHPRYAYRGAMLDVARHFFPVADVKRYIDDIALLKLNHLHLHLTDDQGWRIHLDSWPALTGVGASTQVGGGGGGFYTQDDYREIVEYAASRFVTIVPEIDMPGHTNAAIASYPELGDVPVEPYEGIEVGFSSLAIRSERTYEFVADALRELAELTPGPYLHLGGDESLATTDEDFQYFIARATAIGAATGKTLIGWHEMGRSRDLPRGTIGQYWSYRVPQEGAAEHTLAFVEQGGRVILSPADAIYVDHKYDESTELGLAWANGPTSIADSYEWQPDGIIEGLGDAAILGIEAPLWTETLSTVEQLETMAFPRLASAAEHAWSPKGPRVYADFEPRLAAFTEYLDRLGIHHG
jgi:hexosaminidase